MRFQVLPQFIHEVGFTKISINTPNAPCREYLPTFPLECSHFSPNVGKYSLHGASGYCCCYRCCGLFATIFCGCLLSFTLLWSVVGGFFFEVHTLPSADVVIVDPPRKLGFQKQRDPPGTLNNHFLMDVWWNNHFPSKGLESSNGNNHFKVDVSGTRQVSWASMKVKQPEMITIDWSLRIQALYVLRIRDETPNQSEMTVWDGINRPWILREIVMGLDV